MKVALVHDWLNGMRGGEKVLEVLCELYPDADIYTLIYEPGKLSQQITSHHVTSSFIEKLPMAKKVYRHYLPFFPAAIEQFDLTEYELVISTSHCVAKGVLTAPGTPHLCYCHTPMRYAWEQYHQYFPSEKLGIVKRWFIPLVMSYLRQWDVVSANRVDRFIANSQHVAKRIKKYYNRDAVVVHPPVDGKRFSCADNHEEFYLVVSAMVPYKRIDRAIKACNQLQAPLKIVGKGPELKALKKMAGPTIEFVKSITNEQLEELYRTCKAFLFPGEEDFGITPLEAMASGRPVIAFGVGGALETVVEGMTGVFFNEPTAESMAAAMQRAATSHWESKTIREQALTFDQSIFIAKLKKTIEKSLADIKGSW